MDRLFPGLNLDSHEHATLGAFAGGVGWRKASDTARPAKLAASLQAGTLVRGMAAAAVHEVLLPATQRPNVDELERVIAE